MLRLTTIGRPMRRTRSAKRRCRRNWVASSTQTIRSGRLSPAISPRSTCAVTASSGDRGSSA